MSGALPASWANDKAEKARRYASGEVADALSAAVPLLMPGAPIAALIGVACNGGRNENTTGWVKCDSAEIEKAERVGHTPMGRSLDAYARRGLHELGPFGVEAGHALGPVASPGTPWANGARDPRVVQALGRQGVTGPGAWYGAIADQVTIGVWCLVEHGRGVYARIDPRARPALGADGLPTTWSLWPFALAAMAWSAGNGGCAGHVNAYVDELAALPEAQRWGAFTRLASLVDDPRQKHRADEYSALRTRQKLRAGLLAAGLTHEDVTWFADGLDATERAAVDARLVRIAT